LNQIYSDFVTIVLERLGTFQGDFARALCVGIVNCLAAQERFGFAARQGIGATPPITTCGSRTTPPLLSITVATATIA